MVRHLRPLIARSTNCARFTAGPVALDTITVANLQQRHPRGDVEGRGQDQVLHALYRPEQAPLQGQDRSRCWLRYWYPFHVCPHLLRYADLQPWHSWNAPRAAVQNRMETAC